MPPKKSKTPRKLTPKQIDAMLKKLITSHKLNEKRIKQLLAIQSKENNVYRYDTDSDYDSGYDSDYEYSSCRSKQDRYEVDSRRDRYEVEKEDEWSEISD